MDTQVGHITLAGIFPSLIIIAILVIIVIFCFKMAVLNSKVNKQQKKIREQEKKEGVSVHTWYSHVNGLPIAENMMCEILSYPDRITFKSGFAKITLDKDKITDICIKTDTEIQKQAVSSIGGAVGGAVLFGPLGAVIGGRAKTKKIKSVTNYLIITYLNNNELAYIGFDVTNNPLPANKLIKDFQQNNITHNVQIDLSSNNTTQNTNNQSDINNNSQLSSADEILKFKKLCDDGIISKDEFELKKQELLGIVHTNNEQAVEDDFVDTLMSNVKITSTIVNNDIPTEILNDMRNSYTCAQAQNDVRIFKDCENIMVKTKNLDTFFSRYELASRTLFTLQNADQAGIVKINKNLKDEFFKFAKQCKLNVLQKSYQKQMEDIAKLKTPKSQQSHLQEYLDTLIKYEDEYEFEFDYCDEYQKIVESIKSRL